MVKTDLTDEEKKLIIEALNNNIELPPELMTKLFPGLAEKYAKAHFERVNSKLSTLNLADLESKYRSDAKQYYTFDLLTPHQFPRWIADLKKGKQE